MDNYDGPLFRGGPPDYRGMCWKILLPNGNYAKADSGAEFRADIGREDVALEAIRNMRANGAAGEILAVIREI